MTKAELKVKREWCRGELLQRRRDPVPAEVREVQFTTKPPKEYSQDEVLEVYDEAIERLNDRRIIVGETENNYRRRIAARVMQECIISQQFNVVVDTESETVMTGETMEHYYQIVIVNKDSLERTRSQRLRLAELSTEGLSDHGNNDDNEHSKSSDQD